MKKILYTAFAVMLFGIAAHAQISSNVQIGYLNTLGDGSYRSFGIGGGLQKAFSAKFLIGFSANIYIAGKADMSDTAFAISSFTTPSTVMVDVKRKATTYTGNLDFKYYLVGDAESDMGVYAMVGAGVVKWAIKVKEVGTYNQSQYYMQPTPYVNDLYTGAAFGPAFGAGFEKNIGNYYFFGNGRFTLPLIGDSDPGSGFENPKTLIIEAGLRIPF